MTRRTTSNARPVPRLQPISFFSIGVMSNFRQLWQDGFAKLAAVYLVSLFGFVVWVGFIISWLFFAGVKPPLAS